MQHSLQRAGPQPGGKEVAGQALGSQGVCAGRASKQLQGIFWVSIIGPYELPVLWECLSPQKPHGSRFLIHEDLTMVFLMRGRSSSQLQILAREVQMDKSRIWRWAWRGRLPSCREKSWVCAVCVYVCGGGVCKWDTQGELSCQWEP